MQQFKRTHYLSAPEVADFTAYLVELLEGSAFHHRFEIHDRNVPPTYRDRFGSTFEIGTLQHAFERYFWNNGNYAENKRELDEAEAAVRAAVQVEDEPGGVQATFDAVDRVLKWGAGGERGSLYTHNIAWAKASGAKLVERIRSGRREITSDTPNLTVFKSEARMNAGFTKYYALACQEVIIYDGRVGAAMGLLARAFCQIARFDQVPDRLAFRWGKAKSKGRNRNPSAGGLVFSEFGVQSHLWAKSNIMANWILCEAQRRSRAQWCSGPDGLRRIEAALFMIGYHID